MPAVQLTRSREEQLISTNIENQSSNLKVKTPLVKLVSPMPFKSATGQPQQQQLLPLISFQEPVISGQQSSTQQPSSSVKYQWSSQQLVTTAQQPVTPVTLDQQPLSSAQQSKNIGRFPGSSLQSNLTSVTIVKQPLLPAQLKRTSIRHPEASVQQLVTSVHQPWTPVTIVHQPLSSPELPRDYVMNFLQPEYDPSRCFSPGLLVPVYQLYYSYFIPSNYCFFPGTFQGPVSVSPQMQKGVNSHLDSVHYQSEVLNSGSQED